MSMLNVFDIASSALSAQSQRLNVVASNLANADSAVSASGTPYKARQVVFTAMPIARASQSMGVRVTDVIEDPSAPRLVYDPKHPLADGNGYVTMPNVNVVEEMTNMISASRAYQINLDMMNTAKNLLLKTLALGQ
ncbi:MAG: flagellar basal body rod protein FlgC [Burkholderiales bacterium]|nr:flagellar basal body rod protein FlgC [Burkholderiales bacterium]MCW5621821.1 flagellar basal body rod protein FlgC [Burkholderiales bacterium]